MCLTEHDQLVLYKHCSVPSDQPLAEGTKGTFGAHLNFQLIISPEQPAQQIMFIEKDLRKVQEILEDPSDDRKKLKLGRREAQFNGTIEVLTDAKFHDALGNCEYLSLYNNKLHTIRGIEAFQFSPLESLNLGRNELKTLSSGLGKLGHTLQCLWVEDN